MIKENFLDKVSPRRCGILAHVTSLPGYEGQGDIGISASAFLDFLAESKQSCWAILPLGPINPHYNYNPYISFSSFAGSEDFLCIGSMYQEGLIARSDYEELLATASIISRRRDAKFLKKKMLLSVGNFHGKRISRSEHTSFQDFCERNKDWLEDYASFRAIKDHYGSQAWLQWPNDIAARNDSALRSARKALEGQITAYKYLQFKFSEQWSCMRTIAASKGIKIFGDLPFFCGFDSADVWANQDLFILKQSSHPASWVAMIPPSPDSTSGQIWSTCPIYDWNRIESRAFDWIIRRFELLFERVDIVRLDHFQGYEGTWGLPLDSASQNAYSWIAGPGDRLFRKLLSKLPCGQFVAEDLGFVPESVIKLRDRWNIAGMKVLQYAFDTDHKNPNLPHNYSTTDCVVYTGTHDNDTSVGWYASIPPDQQQACNQYLQISSSGDVVWPLIRYGAKSIGNLFIIPLQDILELGSNCRMNIPGTEHVSWDWVCQQGALSSRLARKLADVVVEAGRARN